MIYDYYIDHYRNNMYLLCTFSQFTIVCRREKEDCNRISNVCILYWD